MPDGTPQIGPHAIDPDHLAGRIGALLAEHRPGAAKPLLAALAKLAPDHPQLALLRAAYCCENQDYPQALAVMETAITVQPGNALLRLRQSEILFVQNQFAEAAQSAAQAVLLAPDFCAAKSRLGLALMRLGQFEQALPCLEESFQAQSSNLEVALALAAVSPATAIPVLTQAIAANPNAVVLHNALARRFLCGEAIELAMRIAQEAIGLGIADAQTHCLLAFAQLQKARWDAALRAAARAQSIAPQNAWAARLIAALSSRETGLVMPAAANDAEAAEHALIAGGAIAPGAFRGLLEAEQITGPVLDIFCGPGLNNIAALGLNIGPWSGIDPSPALIARCAERGIYASLLQSDPLLALAAPPEYPIILLNEVLAYQESPQPLLKTIRACLAPGGIALAAIPTGRPGLSGHGLFTHRETAIAQYAAAAGLSFEAPRTGILRYLEGLPINGLIAVFRPL